MKRQAMVDQVAATPGVHPKDLNWAEVLLKKVIPDDAVGGGEGTLFNYWPRIEDGKLILTWARNNQLSVCVAGIDFRADDTCWTIKLTLVGSFPPTFTKITERQLGYYNSTGGPQQFVDELFKEFLTYDTASESK